MLINFRPWKSAFNQLEASQPQRASCAETNCAGATMRSEAQCPLSAIHPHSLLQRALPGSEKSDREHRQQRVSKRLTDGTAACLRARYCANLAWFDLARMDRRHETSGAADPLQIKNQYRYV